MTRAVLLILAALALSGCVAGKQEYQSYLAAQQARDRQQAIEEQARGERWQKMAEACRGDAACIREVSRDSVLSDAVAALEKSGSGGSDSIQQFQVQAHPATAVVASLGGTLIDRGISGAVQFRQSDNATRVAISANETQAVTYQSAFGLGIAAVNSSAGAVTSVANILPGLAPTQTYTSGGPMSLGNMNIGDQAGRDNVRDGSQVGHSGPINTGTQNTNGVIGAGQIGSGRQNSAGPYRLTDVANVGPRCDGENCQRVPLPEPEPEE
jgi:hypothetical protein